jgi:serine protease DegQ
MRLAPSADGQSTVVTEVWDDWSAADAGFEPGDQVLSVDGQKVAVTAAAEAALLLDSPSEHEVEIRRGSRLRTLNLVRTTVQDSAMQPALAAVSNTGVLVAEIAIGSSARTAGLRDGDRILAINGRPANATTVQNVLGQFKVADIVSVVVQRRGRRLLLVVRP